MSGSFGRGRCRQGHRHSEIPRLFGTNCGFLRLYRQTGRKRRKKQIKTKKNEKTQKKTKRAKKKTKKTKWENALQPHLHQESIACRSCCALCPVSCKCQRMKNRSITLTTHPPFIKGVEVHQLTLRGGLSQIPCFTVFFKASFKS